MKFLTVFLFSLLLFSCDPANEIFIKNGLLTDIVIEVESKYSNVIETRLFPDESASFWIMIGYVKNENMTLRKITNQITLIKILFNDEVIILNRENYFEHKLIKLKYEDNFIILLPNKIDLYS